MTTQEAIKYVKEVTGMSLPWGDNHYEALQMAIAALEQKQWIPVSERLPEREQYYIITYGELVTTCHWFKGSWYGIGDPERVTAWMPFPEPYKS